MNGDPYLVLSSNIAKKDRQKASNNVRMKNLRTGQVIEKTLHQSDVLEEADISKRKLNTSMKTGVNIGFVNQTTQARDFISVAKWLVT